MRAGPPFGANMNIRKLAEQFVKFGIVGALAFLIDYAVLMLLSQALGWDPVVASVVSFCVSLAFNYAASMRFVFSRREDVSRRREVALFVVLSLVGLAINSACMWLGTALAGDGALAVSATKVVATVVVAVWNFASRKRWLEA